MERTREMSKEPELDWIVNPVAGLSLSEMENNVHIIYPYLYKKGWKKQAIKAVCGWMEYLSTINPAYTSQDSFGNPTIGLLTWLEAAGVSADGNSQLDFLDETIDSNAYWTSNPNAEPTKPPITGREWVETEDIMDEVSYVLFGWYYLGREMNYFERAEVLINVQYWSVFIDELPEPEDDSKKKKRKKWIYYMKPQWKM